MPYALRRYSLYLNSYQILKREDVKNIADLEVKKIANENKDYLNGSGCKDFTAYEAIRNIQREERKKLIADIVTLAASRGYEITSNIRLRELE